MEPMRRIAHATLPDFIVQQFQRGGDYHHRQLYRIVTDGILRAALPAGSRLPPTRELAQTLGIARNTIVQVYEQLALEGLLQAGVGRGTYVANLAPAFAEPPAPTPVQRRGTPLSRRGRAIVGGARASAV
ncbi:MAG: winged helix-turn-helix transcriptional regulator, partial [Proteobacteria bacterium]|nr:winged helix-turn-helix transcriptional regulator [Pseudomonadota bacterium]